MKTILSYPPVNIILKRTHHQDYYMLDHFKEKVVIIIKLIGYFVEPKYKEIKGEEIKDINIFY